MIGRPNQKSEEEGFRKAIQEWLSSPQTAYDLTRLMLVGVNYLPTYQSWETPEPVHGIRKSKIYKILQELEIAGDYDKLIAEAEAYELSLAQRHY